MKKPALKTIVCSLLAFGILLGAFKAYDYYSGLFSIENISYDITYHAGAEIPLLTTQEREQLEPLLKQRFNYLGMGNQSYVFESEDGRHVIKFFKFRHLKPSWMSKILPETPLFASYLQRSEARRQRRLERIFNAYHVAYMHDKDNTGILFAHLSPRREVGLDVIVSDAFGREYTINLDNTIFVLQEKGVQTRAVLSALLDKGDAAAAKERIKQLLALYLAEYRRGVYDDDHNVIYNTGFVGDKPIRLDAGKIRLDDQFKDPETRAKDLNKIASKRINKWVGRYYPQFKDELFLDEEYITGLCR